MPRYTLTGYTAMFTLVIDAPHRRAAVERGEQAFAEATIAISAPDVIAYEVDPQREPDGALIVAVDGVYAGAAQDERGEE